jgi:hypothetical protein
MTRAEHKAIQLRCATHTLAKYHAKKRVTAMVRAQGRRVSDFTCRELSLMAESYLAEHRDELMAKAKVWAEEILTKRR